MTAGDALTAAGYMTGLAVFVAAGLRRGLAPAALLALVAAGLGGGAVGAILAQFLATGTPGKSFFGGLLGGWAAVTALKRSRGLRRDPGDLFALALSAGEAVGRWGCYQTGCCGPTQPLQSAFSLALFLGLGARFWRGAPEGSLLPLYVLAQATFRFGLEFWREGGPALAGLRPVQWVCLGLLLWVWRGRSRPA